MSVVETRGVAQWLRPDRPARLVAADGQRRFSRADLRQQVFLLWRRLRALPQRRWALCFDDSYRFTVALLAALHAGKTPVIPGHCRQSLLLEQMDAFDGLLTDSDLTLPCPVLSAAQDAAGEDDGPLPAIDPQACVILFTSGSTGQPRQVSKPIRCLDEESRWLAALWGERLRGCHVLASVTHQHLYGLTFCIWLPMSLGLSINCRQILYSEQLACQRQSGRYLFISSPAFLRRLDRSLMPPACQLIVSAGGELPWPQAQSTASWFGRAVDEIYGSTETGVLAWRSRQRDEQDWQPFPGVTLRLDERQNWWARSALIPQPEGLRLDDKLALSASGGFRICGRHDRIVKIEEKRISLSDIERRLLALPEIVDAAALQVERPERSSIGVVLVLDPAVQLSDLNRLKYQWRHELLKWLEPVALPRFWRVVDEIPHNSQSKRAWPQIQELFHVAR
ncbi:acyl-CoA synthetase [Affinibrenneria salicis]|uniref:Acyl-CoA synthetase n=1 Tax=Affinibrenneria salicis TaxID=2590031 RepID=A0A5J5G4H0_9GAMM|nr:AMP-binding protein [Affinibrenneria salicis]KAA9001939.1 acyl-CoA synthetase [Affinibrenneria salicis]